MNNSYCYVDGEDSNPESPEPGKARCYWVGKPDYFDCVIAVRLKAECPRVQTHIEAEDR